MDGGAYTQTDLRISQQRLAELVRNFGLVADGVGPVRLLTAQGPSGKRYEFEARQQPDGLYRIGALRGQEANRPDTVCHQAEIPHQLRKALLRDPQVGLGIGSAIHSLRHSQVQLAYFRRVAVFPLAEMLVDTDEPRLRTPVRAFPCWSSASRATAITSPPIPTGTCRCGPASRRRSTFSNVRSDARRSLAKPAFPGGMGILPPVQGLPLAGICWAARGS